LEASLAQDEQYQEHNRCILPWIHQHGDLSGNYALCCFTLNKSDRSDVFFGKNTSPLTAWNSDYMKSTRLAMLSNKRVSACNFCYDCEDKGVQSHRQRMNDKFKDYLYLYDKTEEDGSLKSPPIYLDFRFGNLCNFSCRICGADASSSWVKEHKLMGWLDEDAPTHIDEWSNNNSFWSDLSKIKKYVKLVYFAGGEPFVQEGHYRFLQYMIDNECTDIELNYNTNLSYNGDFKGYDILKLWEKFDKVLIWPSIDGYGYKAEYGRKGLDWDLFNKNSKKFDQYISSYSIVSSIYSITSIPELLLWVKEQNKTFFITNGVHPTHLNTTLFDKETKKKITKIYKEFLYENLSLFSKFEVDNILDLVRHMNSSDEYYRANKFYKYNSMVDSLRDESFENTFPELAEWYKSI